MIQTTLDGAAQKWFSVLPLEIKSDWERFTQEFSKMFDSERNQQHQRVLCNEIRRLPNETIKQLAVRIETLVRKAYSLNTHDYKNTKMTEILMMNLTPQLRKIAIKKRASHPSSIREPDLDFRKLVDKLEQAEITMKLEETENLKLQYVNRIETNTTHINNLQESDTDLVEKITEILNIYEKHPNFKSKPSFKNGLIIADDTDTVFPNVDKNNKITKQNKPQKHKEPNKSFYQYMKKDQNLPNKKIYSNNSSGKPLPNNTNYTRNQSPYNSSYRGRSPERRNTQNSSQNNYNRSNSRNNYSRSNSNATQFVSRSSSQSNPRNKTIPIINHETHHTTEIESIHIIEIEVIRTIEIRITRTIDQEITHIIDQTITDQMTIIKTDHGIIHKIEIQVIIIKMKIIPSHHIGIITIIIILNIDTEIVHQNIKDILIKYSQMKKQHRPPRY